MKNLAKILFIVVTCLLPTACDEVGWNPLDPEYGKWQTTNHSGIATLLMEIDVPTLSDTASFYEARLDPQTGFMQRRRTWRGPPSADVSASLLEVQHEDGTPIGDIPMPSVIVNFWHQLNVREKTFQVLYESANAIGPVLWRRFVMGPQTCVAFSQGVSTDGRPARRHLMGYYCAAAGDPLSDGQAETVVRAVRIREGDPTLSPDG